MFFITHGHLYNIKMTLMNLAYKSEEAEADIICFGHSHAAGSELIEGKLFINPGSIRQPRDEKRKPTPFWKWEQTNLQSPIMTLKEKSLRN